eukprot:COSAG04_NODE_26335_length_296_cov_0.654822_2_plen_28_part_01
MVVGRERLGVMEGRGLSGPRGGAPPPPP